MTAFEDKVLGAVLAGGRSSRLAPLDKRWLVWRGEPLWWHSARALAGQCALTAVVVDGSRERFRRYARVAGHELLVEEDSGAPYRGPLSGVARGLVLAAQRNCEWLLTVPCDCVFVPAVLCQTLLQPKAPAAYLEQTGNAYYTVAIWHTSLLPSLQARVSAGDTSLRHALTSANAVAVTLPVNAEGLSLVNINSIAAWRQLSAQIDTRPAPGA